MARKVTIASTRQHLEATALGSYNSIFMPAAAGTHLPFSLAREWPAFRRLIYHKLYFYRHSFATLK